jgi:hypothetical protein
MSLRLLSLPRNKGIAPEGLHFFDLGILHLSHISKRR